MQGPSRPPHTPSQSGGTKLAAQIILPFRKPEEGKDQQAEIGLAACLPGVGN